MHLQKSQSNGVTCREAAAIREATCTVTQKSGSKERGEYQWEVRQQRVRLIWQQESDNLHSQSLGSVS